MQVCFEISLLGFLVSWMVSADVAGPLGWDRNVSLTKVDWLHDSLCLIEHDIDLSSKMEEFLGIRPKAGPCELSTVTLYDVQVRVTYGAETKR